MWTASYRIYGDSCMIINGWSMWTASYRIYGIIMDGPLWLYTSVTADTELWRRYAAA